jgi:hypothetical protein
VLPKPGHNGGACVPSRTSSPSSWIASLNKRRASTPMAPASAARSADGRPARMTFGRVAAATYGTHLTPGEFARPVFMSGLQPSAARVSGGRRIRIGMRSDLLILALKCSPRDRKAFISSESAARLQIGNRRLTFLIIKNHCRGILLFANSSALSSASAALTETSGSTPVPSQFVFEIGFMARANGTPIMKWSSI